MLDDEYDGPLDAKEVSKAVAKALTQLVIAPPAEAAAVNAMRRLEALLAKLSSACLDKTAAKSVHKVAECIGELLRASEVEADEQDKLSGGSSAPMCAAAVLHLV